MESRARHARPLAEVTTPRSNRRQDGCEAIRHGNTVGGLCCTQRILFRLGSCDFTRQRRFATGVANIRWLGAVALGMFRARDRYAMGNHWRVDCAGRVKIGALLGFCLVHADFILYGTTHARVSKGEVDRVGDDRGGPPVGRSQRSWQVAVSIATTSGYRIRV